MARYIRVSYGKEMRERVIAYREAGHTKEATREVFGVSVYAISQWEKRLREHKPLTRDPVYHTFKRIDPQRLEAFVEANPHTTQQKIAEHFGCTAMAVSKALKRHGYSRKRGLNATWSKDPKK